MNEINPMNLGMNDYFTESHPIMTSDSSESAEAQGCSGSINDYRLNSNPLGIIKTTFPVDQ